MNEGTLVNISCFFPENNNRHTCFAVRLIALLNKVLLEQAAISEAHRTLMGTVVERILSVKSGLNEAFTSLLRGFEVRNVIYFLIVP